MFFRLCALAPEKRRVFLGFTSRRVRGAETEVARLEKEQAALVTTLNQATPGTDYSKLNRRLTEMQYELRIATEAWEAAGRELEELDREDAAPAEA